MSVKTEYAIFEDDSNADNVIRYVLCSRHPEAAFAGWYSIGEVHYQKDAEELQEALGAEWKPLQHEDP